MLTATGNRQFVYKTASKCFNQQIGCLYVQNVINEVDDASGWFIASNKNWKIMIVCTVYHITYNVCEVKHDLPQNTKETPNKIKQNKTHI